jgi:hypothetical protein
MTQRTIMILERLGVGMGIIGTAIFVYLIILAII